MILMLGHVLSSQLDADFYRLLQIRSVAFNPGRAIALRIKNSS